MNATLMWVTMGLLAAAVTIGFGTCAWSEIRPQARHAPGRGSVPSPRRSPSPPRPGYLILQDLAPPEVMYMGKTFPPPAPDYPPWDHATQPEPWPAVPEHLGSDQRAALAALEREVKQMADEAWKLYHP